MNDSPDRSHNRRSVRMPLFDYTLPGFYFVTVCAFRRRCVFGSIDQGEACLTSLGRIVAEEWQRTADLRPCVSLDAWVVMPNHFHGIIQLVQPLPHTMGGVSTLREPRSAGAGELGHPFKPTTPTTFGKPVANSHSTIIGAFKAAVTRRAKAALGFREAVVWQRGYFEHVIRDERALERAREYVENNPARWEIDREHPSRLMPDA